MKTIHPAIAEHVMEENERLRQLLSEIRRHNGSGLSKDMQGRIDSALSQQAEPTCSDERPCVSCFSDDGACLAEPAPAQDEQRPATVPQCVRDWYDAKAAHVAAVDAYNARLAFVRAHEPFGTSVNPEYQLMEAADREARSLLGPMFTGLTEFFAAPIAQTEQQPVKLQHMACAEDGVIRWLTGRRVDNCELYAMPDFGRAPKLYAAPIAQATPQPEQSERELMQLVDERDRSEEWANKLSAAIAFHTGAYIGEHSNMNCPWANALEAIENTRPAQTAPQTGARMPCGAVVTNVYEAYEAGKRAAAPQPAQDEREAAGDPFNSTDERCGTPSRSFEREERYMIVKLSKLADDQGDNMDRAEQIYRIAHFGEALVGGVVVEEDWPEHEAVWSMIEARATGKSCPEQKPAAWQLHLPDGRVTLEKTFPSWASDGDGYSIKPLYSTRPAQTEQQTAPQPEQEPFWYAVVSEQAPTINSAIKRLDVAQEFADSKRERWPDTRVVPLYTAPQPEQSGLVEALSEAVEALQEAGDFRAAGKGEKALTSYRAALSSQGESHE